MPDSIPQTNYSVIRVKRDILARSNIGVIGTCRDNNLDGTGGNGLFGMDGNFTFYDNLNVNAYYAKTEPTTSYLDMSSRLPQRACGAEG